MVPPALRTVIRLLGFLTLAFVATIEYGVARVCRRPGPVNDVRWRARWLGRWTPRALRWMGIAIDVRGPVPRSGLIVSNHLGYLDIFVLAAASSTVFVSKSEVRSWPLAGFLAHLAGTVFIDRSRLADVKRVGDQLIPIVEHGQPVTLFLEGTSTGGDRLLPFRASLLEPAAARGWTVTPAFLHYDWPDGAASRDVCYWGDAVFFPHFLRLLGARGVRATVAFGEPRIATGDRRDLAVALRQEVGALGAGLGIAGLQA